MATIENFILRFKVEGGNALTALKDDIKDLASQANPLSSSLGNLAGRMGPLAAGAAAAAGAFAALGLKAIELGDQLDDLSNATGISAGQLMSLRSSLVQAGGDADSFSKAATKLSVAIGEAAGGNEKYQKSFRDLGVFITDANGKVRDSGDILQDTIAALAAIEDPAVRSAKAVEILGKEAAKIDWSNVSAVRNIEFDEAAKQLGKLRGEIDLLRISIDEGLLRAFGNLAEGYNKYGLDDMFARMTEGAGNLAAKIPVVGGLFEYLTKKARESRLEAEALVEATKAENDAELKRLQGRAPAPRPGATRVPGGGFGATPEATLKAIADSKTRIEQSQLEAKKQLELATANDIQKIDITAKYDAEKAKAEIFAKERLNEAQKTAEYAAKEKEIYAKRDADIAKARQQLNAKIAAEELAQAETFAKELAQYYQQVDQARLQAWEQADAIRKGTEELQGRFDLQQRIVDLSTLEQDRQTKLFDLEQQRKASLEAISKIKDLPYDERLSREQQINAEYEKRIGLINQEATVRAQREQDFAAGFRDTMKRYEESLTPIKRGQQLAESVFTNMDRALTGFITTGKLNFKDFASTIIQNLLLIELRANTVRLFQSIGGFLGLRANGGPVTANQPYIVGEKGAELFVPSTSGTVISNARLSSAGAGTGFGSTNVIYNINAVDAPSFQQLVARDPAFIYAVTQQGAKTLPSTRR